MSEHSQQRAEGFFPYFYAMKLDMLAFGVHPDDVELGCAGTLLAQIAKGKTAGIIDLTAGEMGTRGTAEIRLAESENARQLLGAQVRENLHLEDGFFRNDRDAQMRIIRVIRKYQPDIVFCNAVHDRHPDHGRASELVETAAFLAGLAKISFPEEALPAWRPRLILHYIQDRYIEPDIAVDISDYWEQKLVCIRAHHSQFFDPASREPETYISSPEFWENIRARAMEHGRSCRFPYAEGFTCTRTLGTRDISALV